MVRTQIQLPDELYGKARQLAEEKEISLAEVVRRGLEHLLRINPPGREADWELEPPANTQLRSDPFANEDWRLAANMEIPRAGTDGRGRRGNERQRLRRLQLLSAKSVESWRVNKKRGERNGAASY
jgi:hypothetical protein